MCRHYGFVNITDFIVTRGTFITRMPVPVKPFLLSLLLINTKPHIASIAGKYLLTYSTHWTWKLGQLSWWSLRTGLNAEAANAQRCGGCSRRESEREREREAAPRAIDPAIRSLVKQKIYAGRRPR